MTLVNASTAQLWKFKPKAPQNRHGYALSEQMLYRKGRAVTPSFSEYLMPTSMDMPRVCIINALEASGNTRQSH